MRDHNGQALAYVYFARTSRVAARRPAQRRQHRQAAGAASPAAADERGVTRLQRHIHDGPRHVRLHPNAGSIAATHYLTSWAKRRLMHRSKQHLYSITSSAMESSPGGTSMPSARAA